MLVVAYHLWTSGHVSGGVDVFLFLSAYLMTASCVRKGAAFRLTDFLARRFRHLVPMAAIVIAATLAVGWLVRPPTRYPGLLAHGGSSLVYRWTPGPPASTVAALCEPEVEILDEGLDFSWNEMPTRPSSGGLVRVA